MVGDIERLGNWRDRGAGLMRWTDGHWWTLSFQHDEGRPFVYKFVVIDHDSKQALRWEEGVNRICDPEFIPTVRESSVAEKECLVQEWDHFTVTFSIYLPTSNPELEYMRINGATDRLGDWNKGRGPIRMNLGQERQWLTGMTVRPWEHKDIRFSHELMPERLVYKYTIWNQTR